MHGYSFGPDKYRLWGLRPSERAARLFERAGLEVVDSLDEIDDDATVVCLNRAYAFEPAFFDSLLKQENWVVTDAGGEGSLVCAVLKAGDLLEILDGGPVGAGVTTEEFAKLGGLYHETLRRRTSTLVYRLADHTQLQLEWKLYGSSYKGVTDFVTKYLWPAPAFLLTRGACRYRLSPNFVTTLSLILVLCATYLFYVGAYGWGLLAAWQMAILDTVDGKLARVTLRSSRWGEVYDHGIDLIHPPFWYAAWGFGLASYGATVSSDWLWLHLTIIVGGYIAGRLMEGLFLLIAKQEMWVWRRADSLFRLVVARRNPNIVLLSAGWLIGRPDLGLYWVSVWTVLSLIYQAIRTLQAGMLRLRGQAVVSWLSED